MSDQDLLPSNYFNYGSDGDYNDDEKRDDDTCVKCEKTFNRIGGGIYDGVLSYCNNCHATSIVTSLKDDKVVVDTTVDTIRSFLMQMSTLNNADHIEAFRENSYRLDKTASDTKYTRFFICIETVQEKLYWYNQYGAILTSSNAFIFPCGLSDGNIGLMIWRTRCNSPVNHLLVYDVLSKSCYLFKRSWTASLRCDLTLNFDRQEVQQ
jgi:hypothetical protein